MISRYVNKNKRMNFFVLLNQKNVIIRNENDKKENNMSKEYFFLKKSDEKKEILNNERKYYSEWRNKNEESNKPFFAIHSDFEVTCLKDISGGAFKLYTYLGFRAKYRTGEVWESIPEIALFFEKDERTIAKWFSELEKLNLISRHQTGYNRKANTFLKPYGFDIEIINSFLSKSNHENIKKYIEENELRDFTKVLLFNYDFVEYTIILEQRVKLNEFKYHCFIDYDPIDIKELANNKDLKNVNTDNYDIKQSLKNNFNSQYKLLYSELLNYYREEIL